MAEDPEKQEDGSDEESEEIEYLAKSRGRRSTAGKHMHALMDADAEDDLTLLFAEEEDDEEFESGEDEKETGEVTNAADDMELDSSSDEEDHTGTAQDNELEGEQELEKQEKADRLAKKRKASQRDPAGFKIPALPKRVKIDPTASIPPSGPKKRKRSERISWLPAPEDGPRRSSSRRQTMENKELTHARLKRSEQKRIQLIATMEEAARRKEITKPKKQMTQADRLAEAEATERLNTGSLSRWEEMEEKRNEERRLKLEALQNRRLEGPVITFWSGIAKWVNDKLVQVGGKTFRQAEADVNKKKHDKHQLHGKDTVIQPSSMERSATEIPTQPLSADRPATEQQTTQPSTERPATEQQTHPSTERSATDNPTIGQCEKMDIDATSKADERTEEPLKRVDPTEVNNQPPPQDTSVSFLDGIHLYASMPESTAALVSPTPVLVNPQADTTAAIPAVSEQSTNQPEQATQQTSNSIPRDQPTQNLNANPASIPISDTQPTTQTADIQISTTDGGPSASNANISSDKAPVSNPTRAIGPNSTTTHSDATPAIDTNASLSDTIPGSTTSPALDANATQPNTGPPEPSHTPPTERSSRTCIVLENFESSNTQEKEGVAILFNPKKPVKLQKPTPEYCPITSRAARYRDPLTGLSYSNALAYREIRQVLANRYAWSGTFGCFVGPIGVGARGVPERFLAPNAPPPMFVSEDGKQTQTQTETQSQSQSQSTAGGGGNGGSVAS
ncbi:hypothetical protein FQN57_003400 [Myotisia sp. PD_48]|nr:hypothetical protein FQN57_003400 [Myotisia sp. PD_48]